MLYFPDRRYKKLFDLLTYPLPSGLLPYLYAQGLGIWSLPKNSKKAEALVHEHLGIKRKRLLKDGRKVADTAHYDTRRKIIVLPYQALTSTYENVVLHEIGHAVDCLYYKSGSMMSSYAETVEALRVEKPLTDYCAKKHKKTGLYMEQFATAFSAYFCEPESQGAFTNVTDIGPKAVEFFKRFIVKPFERKQDGEV